MKLLYLPAVIFLLFLGAEASAQKNTVFTDFRYYPKANEPLYGVSVGYFRQVGKSRELGLKFSVTGNDPGERGTDSKGFYYEPVYMLFVHLDVTNRWRFAKLRHSNWYAEAGVSGMFMRERYEHYLECGTGVTPEMLAWSRRNTNRATFNPGLASAVSWEYSLGQKFSLGMTCMVNLYFVDSDNFSNLMLCPSLRGGYRF